MKRHWSDMEYQLHINLLEFWAIRYALTSFATIIEVLAYMALACFYLEVQFYQPPPLAWLPVPGGGKSTFLLLGCFTGTTNSFWGFWLRGIELLTPSPTSEAWPQGLLLPTTSLLQGQNASLVSLRGLATECRPSPSSLEFPLCQ